MNNSVPLPQIIHTRTMNILKHHITSSKVQNMSILLQFIKKKQRTKIIPISPLKITQFTPHDISSGLILSQYQKFRP